MSTLTLGGSTLANKTGSVVSINDGVILPAGSVLQMVHNSTQETNTLDQTYKAYWSPSITLKSANSDIYCIHNATADVAAGAGYGYQVRRNTSAYASGESASNGTLVYNENATASDGSPWSWYGGGSNVMDGSIYFKDTLSGYSVGNTLYYGFYIRKYDGDSVAVPHAGSGSDGFFHTILFEVQK